MGFVVCSARGGGRLRQPLCRLVGREQSTRPLRRTVEEALQIFLDPSRSAKQWNIVPKVYLLRRHHKWCRLSPKQMPYLRTFQQLNMCLYFLIHN